jgi:DNA-directed RNA polymerase subunit N (RpoN/RPB10)
MLYVICPTCGYFLGYKTLEWEKKSAEICNDHKLSDEEKETKKTELIISLNLPRYCCRMRMMTYKDIVQDIIPIQKEEQKN